MKLRLILIMCLMCSTSELIKAQEFKLSDYRLPDLTFRSLGSSFSFRNSGSRSFDNDNASETLPTAYEWASSFNYLGLKNTSLFQKRSTFSSNQAFNISDTQSSNNQHRNTIRFSSVLNIEQTNRKYIQAKTFQEINYHLNTTFRWSKQKIVTNGMISDVKSYTLNILAIVPLKIGKGRIDPVSDARHAIFIIKKLKEEGHLQRDFKASEIRELAEVISKLDYKRYFDFRLRRIYELKQVDSFLQSKNLIAQTDIDYFTQLNDMWAYGRGPVRYSGKRFSYAFYPGYNYLIQDDQNEDMVNILFFNMGIEYEFDHPIDLYWQNTFTFYSYTGLIGGNAKFSNSTNQTFSIPKVSLGATDKLGFYPNTRTQLELTGGFHLNAVLSEIDRENNKRGLNGYNGYLSSGLEIEHYLSPRLRLGVDLLTSYRFVNFTDESGVSIGSDGNSNLSYLLNYPHCRSSYCFQNGSDGKRFSSSFSILLRYALF